MSFGNSSHSARDEAIAGCTAGLIGTILGFPLDGLKTRMQAGAGLSMRSLARQIYKSEGFKGFYRGVASPLAALTVLNTLNFSSYAYFRKQLGVRDNLTTFEYRIPLAAACVGPLSSLISTPFELIKTQMVQSIANSKASGSSPVSTSSIQKAIELVRQHGVRVLFIAHGINTLREIVFLSTYFSVYEHSKDRLATLLPAQVAVLISGGVAGATGWFVSFPLDCIKSNKQGRNIEIGWQKSIPSAWAVATTLIRLKGIAGLYAGIIPSIARAFLVSSSRFAAYEGTLWLLQ